MSIYSPQSSHVGSLIDQRSTRADIHGRFSAISEFSDTPSVYSRPCFSPESSVNGENRGSSFPTSPVRSHRDQLDDHDIDDYQRSSFAPSETFKIDDGEGDNSSISRMSYLGPKMRFHSRAPWELEDDALEEVAEPEEGHRPFQSVFSFGNSATSPSSSPRPSYATSRPSGESTRSQAPPKRSFDTVDSQISHPRGAFYALAQESLSSYSLGRSTPPAQKETLRSKFSLGRLRSESSNFDSSPSSNPSPGRSPLNGRFPFPPSPRDNDPFVASVELPMRTTSRTTKGNSQDSVHPYANPDLVVSSIIDHPIHSPLHATSKSQQRGRDEANITLSESCTTDSISRSNTRFTFVPDTTVNSALLKHRISPVQVNIISSPVTVISALHPSRIETPLSDNRLEQNSNPVSPGINNLLGWTDPNAVPAFSLISLEEARAQRMRSATANPTSRTSSASGLSNHSASLPLIETEAIPGANLSHVGSSTRARARSISLGANKARSALHTIVGQPKPERQETEPTIIVPQLNSASHSGKSLKHKKSGFMRLFNAGKVPEKDERPPVPSLPDSHSFNHIQPVVQHIPKSSIHRIPVPDFSPPLCESASAQSSDTFMSDTWKPSTKCTPPILSINVQPPAVDVASASIMDNGQNHIQVSSSFTLNRPWQNDQPLRSAPAEFPALKLRPVSTLFSAHFTDHIVATESKPSPETPRSRTLTPASATRTSDAITSLHDQASVVRSLEEQLVTSKKAWQLHIWELEGQVRDLKATVEELKASDNKGYCQNCGRGKKEVAITAPHSGSVVHRPRARTGTLSRFTNALP